MEWLGLEFEELSPELCDEVTKAAQLAVDAKLPLSIITAAAAGNPVEL